MAATVDVSVIVELMGLGKDEHFIDKATDGTTPESLTKNYRLLDTTNTSEALDLGAIDVVTILAIKAIDYDLFVDLDNSDNNDGGFDEDFTVKAGEPAAVIPNPAGNIWVKNAVAGESPNYEFMVLGTTT